MINCKDCFYWDRGNDSTDDSWNLPPGLHKCTKIQQLWSATEYAEGEWPEETPLVRKREFENDLAFVNDGESYKAELLTLEDFGCVMGEKLLSTGKDPD